MILIRFPLTVFIIYFRDFFKRFFLSKFLFTVSWLKIGGGTLQASVPVGDKQRCRFFLILVRVISEMIYIVLSYINIIE